MKTCIICNSIQTTNRILTHPICTACYHQLGKVYAEEFELMEYWNAIELARENGVVRIL